jgi:hypothetical protein
MSKTVSGKHHRPPKPVCVLHEQIDREIAERRDDTCFLSGEWRHLRLAGYGPDEIDYDMCHVWR